MEEINYKTIDEYIEHLKSLTTASILENESTYYELAKFKEWDIEPLKKYLEEAKKDTEEAKKEKTDFQKIKEGSKTIGKIHSNFNLTNFSDITPNPYLWENFSNDIKNYDPEKDFCPSLFDKLQFPNSTLSIIGARTSRGKTTALVNLALEAVKANRKCLFITLEMTGRQLFNKLILLKAYTSTEDYKKENLKQIDNPHKDLFKILKSDCSQECNNSIKGMDETFETEVKGAVAFIKEKIKNKELQLIQAWPLTQEDIINLILKQEKETLVLIDYIQRMPVSDEAEFKSGYMRIKQISSALVAATIKKDIVTICGAQFNRMSSSSKNDEGKNKEDKFDDTSFRESGDIEQDAHNAIGIGWEDNKQDRFYEILKARESSGVGRQYSLEFNGAYSYMKNRGVRKGKKEKTTNLDRKNTKHIKI